MEIYVRKYRRRIRRVTKPTIKTEIATDTILSVMRRQIFIDGNKRVAMLFANKIMIENGWGIIMIAQENQTTIYEK